jgi:hypothetical protein
MVNLDEHLHHQMRKASAERHFQKHNVMSSKATVTITDAFSINYIKFLTLFIFQYGIVVPYWSINQLGVQKHPLLY